MFQLRLIRDDDALIIFESYAYLIRQYGLPARPPVPSPLHKNQGLDTLSLSDRDTRTPHDWAHDNLAIVLNSMEIEGGELLITPSTRALSEAPDTVTYDPERLSEPGQFSSRLVLQLVEKRLNGFDAGIELNPTQQGLVRLAAIAYHRQGFAMSRCLTHLAHDLAAWRLPTRLIDNALIFSACLGLRIQRQTPEQIIATYGSILSRASRRKIRPACRQLESFDAEIKLLQIFGSKHTEIRASESHASPHFAGLIETQPQRISWT